MSPCATPLRSVYLHNNKLADAGLPDNMFNGSSNVEILILSSNFLRHVPKHLPPALYKLHIKVGGRGQTGHPQSRAQAHMDTVQGCEALAQHPLQRSRQKPGLLVFSPTPRVLQA